LVAAAGSLGWNVVTTPGFWLAVGGIGLTALLNVGVAFGGALMLALRARDVPRRLRRLVFRTVAKRLALSPGLFLLPGRHEPLRRGAPIVNEEIDSAEEQRTGSGD